MSVSLRSVVAPSFNIFYSFYFLLFKAGVNMKGEILLKISFNKGKNNSF